MRTPLGLNFFQIICTTPILLPPRAGSSSLPALCVLVHFPTLVHFPILVRLLALIHLSTLVGSPCCLIAP